MESRDLARLVLWFAENYAEVLEEAGFVRSGVVPPPGFSGEAWAGQNWHVIVRDGADGPEIIWLHGSSEVRRKADQGISLICDEYGTMDHVRFWTAVKSMGQELSVVVRRPDVMNHPEPFNPLALELMVQTLPDFLRSAYQRHAADEWATGQRS